MKQIATLYILQATYFSSTECSNYFKDSSRSQPFLRKTFEVPSFYSKFVGYSSYNKVQFNSAENETVSSIENYDSSEENLMKETETLSTTTKATSADFDSSLTPTAAPTLSERKNALENPEFSDLMEETETLSTTTKATWADFDSSLATAAPTSSELKNEWEIPEFSFDTYNNVQFNSAENETTVSSIENYDEEMEPLSGLTTTVAPTSGERRNALEIPEFLIGIETYSTKLKIRENNLLEATEFYLTEYLENSIDHNLKFEEVTLKVIENGRRLSTFSSQNQTYVFKGYTTFKNLAAAKNKIDIIMKLIEKSFTVDKAYYLSLLTKSGMQVSDVTFTWAAVSDKPQLEINDDKSSYYLYLIIAAAAAFLAVATILIVWGFSHYHRKKPTNKEVEEKKQISHHNVDKDYIEEHPREATAKLSLEKLEDATPVNSITEMDNTSVVSELTFGTHWPKQFKQKFKSPTVIDETDSVQTTDKIETRKKSDLASVCTYQYSLPDGVVPSIYGGLSAKVPTPTNNATNNKKVATVNVVDDEDLFISTYTDDYP